MAIKIDFKSFTQKKPDKDSNNFPVGTRVYKGFQGTGKTLSMVRYGLQIADDYDNAQIFSNISIRDSRFQYFKETSEFREIIANIQDIPDAGTLILLDEAHLFFGRKTGIPLDVLSAISQQRKRRCRLVFSSQIWEELDISLRKQVKEIVQCSRIGNIQILNYMNGETLTYDKLQGEYQAQHTGYEIYKTTKNLAGKYETRQIIVTNEEYGRRERENRAPALIQIKSRP